MGESYTYRCGGPLVHRDHLLKTWPEQFVEVASGRKTVELRKNDRGYRVGDELVLIEYDPVEDRYTGRFCQRTVTHVLEGGQFGLATGYVALSLHGDQWFTSPALAGLRATGETPEPRQIER